jgi:hypothetical protein
MEEELLEDLSPAERTHLRRTLAGLGSATGAKL